MSFHHIKLQNDALHSLCQAAAAPSRASSNANDANSSPTTIIFHANNTTSEAATAAATATAANTIVNDSDNHSHPNDHSISDSDCGDESWTTMSEIDSQYSRSIRFGGGGGVELSMITDSDCDRSEHHHELITPKIANQSFPHPPVGFVATTPTYSSSSSSSTTNNDHQSIASGRIVSGATMITSGSPRSRHQIRCDETATTTTTAKLLQAREELETVTKNLQDLQERHETKVRELQQQLAEAKQLPPPQEPTTVEANSACFDTAPTAMPHHSNAPSQQHPPEPSPERTTNEDPKPVGGGVAVVELEYNDLLDRAVQQRATAEAKLETALATLRLVESEKAEQTRELHTKLETTRSNARLAHDQRSEYKTNWESSLERTQAIESELVVARRDLEDALRTVETLREQHASDQRRSNEQLEAQRLQTEQLQTNQRGLEQTVRSLETERSVLQQQIRSTISRNENVEADLSKANENCHKLSSELETLRTSMVVLESNHARNQQEWKESMETQLGELKDRDDQISKLREDAKALHLEAKARNQENERLEEELMEARDKARDQKKSLALEMEGLRNFKDALVAKDASNEKLALQQTQKIRKLKADSKAARKKAQAMHEQETRRWIEIEQKLLRELKECRDKAHQQKAASKSKLAELRDFMDALAAKDELNEKMLLEQKAEIVKLKAAATAAETRTKHALDQKMRQHQEATLRNQAELRKLKADSEAAQKEANAKHAKDQSRFQEVEKQLLKELKEAREKAHDQKESSELELDEFRKSIDALVAKDELELDRLQKSFNDLADRDKRNQKILSEHEAEELKLKADLEATTSEALAKLEEERRRSKDAEEQLLSDFENSRLEAKSLRVEKDALEETIVSLKEAHSTMNRQLVQANSGWEAAEETTKRLTEEKRLINAELNASRYSVLRLEAEQSRMLAERGKLVESHKLELNEQRSIVSSIREAERILKTELEIVRSDQSALKESKIDLKTRLDTMGDGHRKLLATHDSSMQNFRSKIQELQRTNDCLERTCNYFESSKVDWECQVEKLREEIVQLQKTQQQTKLQLHREAKEKDESLKASIERCEVLEGERDELCNAATESRAKELEICRELKENQELAKAFADRLRVLERERNDLRDDVSALHAKQHRLQKKLKESATKLEEKDKIQDRLEELLSTERIAVQELQDEKLESMRRVTSMSVVHANSLLKCQEEKDEAQEIILRVKQECFCLETDMALTTAENHKLAGILGAVEEELGQVREEHKQSKEKIEELLVTQDESRNSSNRQIAELMHQKTLLETTIALLSAQVESNEASIASLKEELEMAQTDVLETRKKEEESKNEFEMRASLSEQKISELSGLLKNTGQQLEEGEKEKSLLLSILQDHIKSMECASAENKKLQECLDSSETEKEELRSNYATAQSLILKHDGRIGVLAKKANNLELEIRNAGEREDNLGNELRLIKDENAALRSSKHEMVCEHKREVARVETSKMEIVSNNDRLVEELRLLNDRQSALAQERDFAAIASREANEKLNDYRVENTKLVKQCDRSLLRIESLETETELLRKQTQDMEAAKCKLETASNSVILDLKREKARLEAEAELLQKRVETMGATEVEFERAAKLSMSELERGNNALLANLNDAKVTIATLKTEAATAAKGNSLIVTNLQGDLTVAKETIAALQTGACVAAVEQIRLKEEISTLQINADKISNENSFLNAIVKVAKSNTSTLQAAADKLTEENSRLIVAITEAKESIIILEKEGIITAKENAIMIKNAREVNAELQIKLNEALKETALLTSNLDDAKDMIFNLRKESSEVEKENTRLIANEKEKNSILETKANNALRENKSLAAGVRDAKTLAENDARLIVNLKGILKEAEEKNANLISEFNEAEEQNVRLITNLKDSITEAKGTISKLQSEFTETEEQNVRLIANLKNELKEAKGTFTKLQSEFTETEEQNVRLIANLKNKLKEAKGMIDALQKTGNESSSLIANLKKREATNATLRTELEESLSTNSIYLNSLEDLRKEIANTKDMAQGIETDRDHLKDEMEQKLTKLKEELRVSTLLQTIGEETIQSLQNDVMKARQKTLSFKDSNKILQQEKIKLECRLKEIQALLARKINSERTRNKCNRFGHQLRDISPGRQLEGANTMPPSEQDLRSVDAAKIMRLEGELEQMGREKVQQLKTTRKLAKLLKRTMNSATRVSRMKVHVDMRYFDTETNEYRKLPSRAEYSGSVVDSKPHGNGIMKFENGHIYLGTFENGSMCHDGSYIASTQNPFRLTNKGKLQSKGFQHDYNDVQRLRIQH